jgi:hypothetical protein
MFSNPDNDNPMKNPRLCLLLMFLIIAMAPGAVKAQEADSTLMKVETTDGNKYIGTILSETNETLTLKTDHLGKLTFKKSNIVRITPVQGGQVKNGVLWSDNPQATRYFWTPNGYGLKKGEAYYQNVWIFFNQFSVGVTDNFSMGAGLVPLFLFAGSPTPVWITPKLSIPIRKDEFNLGGGALLGTVLGEESEGFGIVYGMTTFGSRDKNISVGIGYGYAGGEWADTPTFSISGIVRTGQNGYFMSENYYIDTGEDPLMLISLGGRRIVNRTGIDFGLFIPFVAGLDNFIAIPWLGLSAPLNKRTKTFQ